MNVNLFVDTDPHDYPKVNCSWFLEIHAFKSKTLNVQYKMCFSLFTCDRFVNLVMIKKSQSTDSPQTKLLSQRNNLTEMKFQ